MSAQAGPVADSAALELIGPEPTAWRSFWASFRAVATKESRWRMRGRRAFVVVTIYLALLALLVFGVVQLLQDRTFGAAMWNDELVSPGIVSAFTSTAIGQAVFISILVVQTLLTALIGPALTSGAISIEREKQTLELLITTPVSTLGLVVGKLVSSLAYLLLLVLASIPLASIVFIFGGVAPEDVVRGYLMLFAMAFGVGAIGLFLSALFKRTQVATALAYVVMFGLVVGTFVLHAYLLATSPGDRRITERRAPEAIVWLNPIVGVIDVVCTAIPDSAGGTCSYSALVVGVPMDPADPPRDLFWPRSAAAFIVLGTVLTVASTQLIAPTRRPLRRRRLAARRSWEADPG